MLMTIGAPLYLLAYNVGVDAGMEASAMNAVWFLAVYYTFIMLCVVFGPVDRFRMVIHSFSCTACGFLAGLLVAKFS